MSQPSWAAWIEILIEVVLKVSNYCRSPLWLRGLKFFVTSKELLVCGRSPLGLRGLKYRRF